MGDFKDFIKSKTFLKNLGLAILLLVLFFWGAVQFLSYYTRHGEFIVLQNLTNKKLVDVQKSLKDEGLNYIVIDSAFDEKTPPGMVINQNPYAGAHVKKGRNIYLYITSSVPPMVVMPNLVDKSLRQATLMIENTGLKFGGAHMEPDPCNGCVLKQLYKGSIITPGTKILKGSTITLIIGRGNVPDSLSD
jgi:eukaryotic-like serine/threonine-protein kinase